MMGAELLNRHLTLEAQDRTPDGAGGFTRDWSVVGIVWARIEARTGRDIAGEAVSLSSTAYRIVVRAAPFGAPSRPMPGQRFRDGTRVFRVLSVAERDTTLRYLTCFCEEEVAL